GAGIFMLSFAPFRGTAAITERYLGFMIAVGIKLFTIYLLLSAGGTLAPVLAGFITDTTILHFNIPLIIAGLAWLFALAAKRMPALASSIALGGVNVSAMELVHSTLSMIRAAGAIAAAAFTGAAVGALAVGTASVAQAALASAGGGWRG